MNIKLIICSLVNYRVSIKTFEVIRETEKCYFAKLGSMKNEAMFLKDELNKVRHMSITSYPYLALTMADATEEELRRKLQNWFITKAKEIWAGEAK